MDLYSNQIIRGIKSFLGKINIQTSNSTRTYYLEAGADNEYRIDADPGGSFRATEFELNFRSFIPNLTRDGHGSNIKCIISTDANSSNLRTLSGNYYAANFYSNLISTHTTVNRIAGVNALADVGSNLAGTTVTNLTSVLARGVAARANTVVTNAHAIYAESPKHGENRYSGYFEKPSGGTGINLSIKADGRINSTEEIEGRVLIANGLSNQVLQLKTNKVFLGSSVVSGNTGAISGDIIFKLNASGLIEDVGSFLNSSSALSTEKQIAIPLPTLINSSISNEIPIPISSFNQPFRLRRIDIFATVASPGLTDTDFWRIELRRSGGLLISNFDFTQERYTPIPPALPSRAGNLKYNWDIDENMPVFSLAAYYCFRIIKVGNPPDLVFPSLSIGYVVYL